MLINKIASVILILVASVAFFTGFYGLDYAIYKKYNRIKFAVMFGLSALLNYAGFQLIEIAMLIW